MAKSSTKRVAAEKSPAKKGEPFLARVERMLDRHAVVLTLALILLGSIRIVSTYTIFSQTSDEPAHIGCGLQWLDRGVYSYEPQHPPLTRVMAAVGPYLDGARCSLSEMFTEGNAVLYAGNGYQYDRRLGLSRAGNLPFFWLAGWMVFLWGRLVLGDVAAVVAVFVFTMIPTVLAHAGLSTTDMGATACFTAAAYATLRLVQNPGPKTATWLGLAGGLMVLSKFSLLVYWPAAVGAALALWLYRVRPAAGEFRDVLVRRLPWLGLAALLGFAVIWAGYRFSFGKSTLMSFPVPFPELYSGIKQVAEHNNQGHLSYFMGQVRIYGWWLFFPVLLAVKLPLVVLGLVGVGIWKRPKELPRALLFAILVAVCAAILAAAMPSSINIGIRHILPMFPFLAVIAAGGALWLARQAARLTWARWALSGAFLWLSGTSLAAHPDYLAYFNALAGGEPERIVVDSDLDWGQDIKRLSRRLKELNVKSVSFSPSIMVNPPLMGFPLYQLTAVDAPFPGWNAVQVTHWKLYRMGLRLQEPNTKVWPDFVKPVERVGSSIYLYYIPPQPANNP
jgi:4-amino-4-deoxy-L-arabinose transferase-like glycosyltransferase